MSDIKTTWWIEVDGPESYMSVEYTSLEQVMEAAKHISRRDFLATVFVVQSTCISQVVWRTP